MSTKTILIIFISTFILTMTTALLAKYLVLPIKNSISNKTTEIAKLTEINKNLLEQLANTKDVVTKELVLARKAVLIKYISENTTVLNDEMINDAAEHLTKASINHNIPLELLVGIAKATSEFNTTYFSVSGHRGILALPKSQWELLDNKVKNVNRILVGTDVGASALKELNKNDIKLDDLLLKYFDDFKYFENHKNNIYKTALEFACYDK